MEVLNFQEYNNMGQDFQFLLPPKLKHMEQSFKKKTTLGKVTDGFPIKRSLKSSVVYRVIKKMKSTVIITSDHSRLSFELPKKTVVYVS